MIYFLKNVNYNFKNNAKISSSGKAVSSLFFKRIQNVSDNIKASHF